MEYNPRGNWIFFLVVLFLVLFLAFAVNIFRMFTTEKAPVSATSVMHITEKLGKYYSRNF